MQTIKKILVIDSDSVCVFILKQNFLLTELSPLWVHRSNATDAIAYLTQNDMPDLIFLDPVLPDMQQSQVFEKLNILDVFNKTKVSILTTYPEKEFGMLGNEFNILRKFSKPFHKNQLKELLHDLKAA